MAAVRLGSTLSRSLFRGSRIAALPMLPARAPIALIMPRRPFASATGSLRNAVSTPDSLQQPVAQSEKILSRNARTILLSRVPPNATMQQIKSLFQDAGTDVVSVTMRVNKFTLLSDHYATVELASQEQVTKALTELKDTTLNKQPFVMLGMRPEGFNLDRSHEEFKPWRVMNEQNEYQILSQALKPFREKRRVIFRAVLPAWASPVANRLDRRNQNTDVIVQNVSKYGIESMSTVSDTFRFASKVPKFMCYIDFATTEGAEQAIRELDGTKVKDRQISVELSRISPWTAHQIGEWSPELLKELQQIGLAREETMAWLPRQLRDSRVPAKAPADAPAE